MAREKKLTKWSAEKKIFIDNNWNAEIVKLRWHTAYFFYVLLVTFFPIVIGFVLKANDKIIRSMEQYGINQWYVWGVLTLVLLGELFGRAYIFNKEKVKNGWEWFVAFFKKSNYNSVMTKRKKNFEDNFILLHGACSEIKNESK